MGLIDGVKNMWSAFTYRVNTNTYSNSFDSGSSQPVYAGQHYSKGSIIDTIITKIAIDVSMVEFQHVKKTKGSAAGVPVKSGLNNVLTLSANIDENYIEFMQDIVFSMLQEGRVCVVPTHTSRDPNYHKAYQIYKMRAGKIVQWYNDSVDVRLYNEEKGTFQTIRVKKANCAIIVNPLYYVLNADNSTLKRLARKLALLDSYDEDLASNTLNMILQFPYEVRSDQQIKMANDRVKQIESQLAKKHNKHGIAWIGGNEKFTQVGANKENNLLTEVKELTQDLFNQLGLTETIFKGTATEQELSYYTERTIYPICKRIALEFTIKFLTETARTQGHSIIYKTDPFKLVPMDKLVNIVDVLKRNALITTNEGRSILHFDLSDDPSADTLFNPNVTPDPTALGGENQNGGDSPEQPDLQTIMSQLSEEDQAEVIEYSKGILGADENVEEAINAATEEQIQQITEYAQQLLDSQGEETEE